MAAAVDRLDRVSTAALLRALGGGPKETKMLACLRAAPGHVASTSELIDYVYGGDPEGGPDTAHWCIHVTAMRLRRAGIALRSERVGYRLMAG